jgi:hypothetical protein
MVIEEAALPGRAKLAPSTQPRSRRAGRLRSGAGIGRRPEGPVIDDDVRYDWVTGRTR